MKLLMRNFKIKAHLIVRYFKLKTLEIPYQKLLMLCLFVVGLIIHTVKKNACL